MYFRFLGITHYEAARRLIRILYTKVNGYARFLNALDEGGYDFLAQQIDSSTGDGITEGDLAWASKGYLHDFHDSLQQQTGMMKKFMKEMDDLKRSQALLLNQNVPRSSTPDSLGGVRVAMEKHGLTQDEVVRYLEFRMTQPDVVDGPVDVSSPTSISLESALASYTQSLTALLTVDIIYYSTSIAKKQQVPTAPNIYAKTLRKSVYDVINNKYKEEFLRSVTLLQIKNAHCYTTMTKVLDEIIDKGEMNWGRVVVVYAFCSWLAQQIAVMGDDDVAKSIGGFLAFHITRSTNFCNWIDKNGGFVSE